MCAKADCPPGQGRPADLSPDPQGPTEPELSPPARAYSLSHKPLVILCRRSSRSRTPSLRITWTQLLEEVGLTQNFLSCDRDQDLMLPPSIVYLLAESPPVLFFIETIESMRPRL